MKSNKQLDEMQENKLLKIQEKGFWLVFWILFAAIFVQAYCSYPGRKKSWRIRSRS